MTVKAVHELLMISLECLMIFRRTPVKRSLKVVQYLTKLQLNLLALC